MTHKPLNCTIIKLIICVVEKALTMGDLHSKDMTMDCLGKQVFSSTYRSIMLKNNSSKVHTCRDTAHQQLQKALGVLARWAYV